MLIMHSFIDAARKQILHLSPFKERDHILFEVVCEVIDLDKSSWSTRFFYLGILQKECDRQFIHEYYNDNTFPHGMKARVRFSLKGDIISLQTISYWLPGPFRHLLANIQRLPNYFSFMWDWKRRNNKV